MEIQKHKYSSNWVKQNSDQMRTTKSTLLYHKLLPTFSHIHRNTCLTYKRQQTNSKLLMLCSLRDTHPQTRNKTAQPCLCESKECRKCYEFMTLIMHFYSLCFRSHWCVSHYTWPLTPSHNTPLQLLLPVVGSVYSLLLLCCQCLSSGIYVMFVFLFQFQ